MIGERAENVVAVRVDTAQLLVHGGDFIGQVLVLVLRGPRDLELRAELAVFLLAVLKCSLETLNVVNS